jgi:hypothetical protein
MPSKVELALNGAAAEAALYSAVQLLEVEENADRPGSLLLRLPVTRTANGDLRYVGDGTFEPGTNVTVVLTVEGQEDQCIFDGYVLSWHLHLDRSSTSSAIDVWMQDASWLMCVEDTVREWSGMTDGEVANAIFSKYSFEPASENEAEPSPAHEPEEHSLLQRANDLQFLRGLARRDGKLCRVGCTSTPGERTGYFVTPDVGGEPEATITLVEPTSWNVDSLEFDWDVMRPTEVQASQASLEEASEEGIAGNSSSSGVASMGERDYGEYAETPATLLLTATADPPELTLRSTATLRESGWFARCRGETTVDRLGKTLRAGTVVLVEGAGSLHSGKWLVWSVRHEITASEVKLQFTLLRNAVGAPPEGGLLGALGASL